MDYKQRMKIEERVITNLVQTAAKHGFSKIKVNDGDVWEPVDTLQEVIETVFSVDECRIAFRHPDTKWQIVYAVLGNDGWDVIADHSCGDPLWDAVMVEVDGFINSQDI